MIKKTFKILIFIALIIAFLIFVDLESFSIKTVKPLPINEVRKKQNEEKYKNQEKESAVSQQVRQTPAEDQGKDFIGNPQDIINLANQAREKEGLSSLKENPKLSQSAMRKAQHMRDNDYFEHTSPNGIQPWYFAEKAGYEYKVFGENLAEGFFSAESVHKGWMDSPGHRENILSEEFEEIGVGILDFKREGKPSYLIVQHFASPIKQNPQETINICDLESKENCEEAENRLEEVEEIIEEQEQILDEALERGAEDESLERIEDNLEKLKETKDEIEDYIKECNDFLSKCDKWQ
jgi:uncharacterized protein YkwD